MVLATPLNRIPAIWVDEEGRLTREAFRFLLSLQGNANEAAAGEVATPAAGGLQGGGAVADGVTLSIATNGVTRPMLAQGLPTSVIGRFPNSAGNVADIQAVSNNSVLSRQSNQLVFTPYPVVDKLTAGTLIVATHTPSSATDTGEAGTIAWDASYIYICVATNSWERVAIAPW